MCGLFDWCMGYGCQATERTSVRDPAVKQTFAVIAFPYASDQQLL